MSSKQEQSAVRYVENLLKAFKHFFSLHEKGGSGGHVEKKEKKKTTVREDDRF